MSKTPLIQSVEVDGRDIHALIFNKLRPAVQGEQISHSVLAMLTLSALLMKPDIEIEALQDIVMDTSKHMLLQLSPIQVTGEAN